MKKRWRKLQCWWSLHQWEKMYDARNYGMRWSQCGRCGRITGFVMGTNIQDWP